MYNEDNCANTCASFILIFPSYKYENLNDSIVMSTEIIASFIIEYICLIDKKINLILRKKELLNYFNHFYQFFFIFSFFFFILLDLNYYYTHDYPLILYYFFADYLCEPDANIYDIEFTRFKIRDLDTDQVLFEIAKPTAGKLILFFSLSLSLNKFVLAYYTEISYLIHFILYRLITFLK